jgi:hypothetical protein
LFPRIPENPHSVTQAEKETGRPTAQQTVMGIHGGERWKNWKSGFEEVMILASTDTGTSDTNVKWHTEESEM